MTEMFQQNRERELHMQIRLQEARNEEIKMRQTRTALEQDTVAQLQLFNQQMASMEDRIVSRLSNDLVRSKELEVRKLELQIELARLEAQKHLALGTAEVEFELTPFMSDAAVAKAQVEEQFESKRRGRKKKDIVVLAGKVEEVINPLEGKVEEVIEHPCQGLYTPLRRGMRGLGVDWRAVDDAGLFETVLIDIVLHAREEGANIYKSSKFKNHSKRCNGAYQQFGLRNKGIRTWEEFINQHFGALV
jgi:hypothetical protein